MTEKPCLVALDVIWSFIFKMAKMKTNTKTQEHVQYLPKATFKCRICGKYRPIPLRSETRPHKCKLCMGE